MLDLRLARQIAVGDMVGDAPLSVVEKGLAVTVGGAEIGLLPGFLAASVARGLVRKAFLADLPALALLDHPEIASDHEQATSETTPGLQPCQPIEATRAGLRTIAIPSRLAMNTAVRAIGTPKA